MNWTKEAHLLYALLEGAEEEGRLADPALKAKWLRLKAAIDETRIREHADLSALYAELERTDALAGTWIQFQWLKAKERRTQHASIGTKRPRTASTE